ncbi:MAG: hypothetical protein JTT11_09500 [Candidatus Brockarchaeota archaeon]|nr:hypothetical protein [Candidatus Brockarchaeota archaeon]
MKAATWVFGLPKNREKALSLLKKLKFEAVTVGKEKEAVDAIVREGLEAHVAIGAFSLRGAGSAKKALLSRRLDGTPVTWFGSGCPNNAKIRESSLNRVEEAASMEGVKAVILDGIRFASPGEGIETFMTCFCGSCRRKARDMGYDMDEMKKSLLGVLKSIKSPAPSALETGCFKSPVDAFGLLFGFPGLLEWLRFRAECVIEHVAEVRKAVRSVNGSCKLGAYLFAPSLSFLVGQDYARLPKMLDYVEPMIYRTGKGVACINCEVAKIASDLSKGSERLDEVKAQELVFNFLGLPAKTETTIERLAEGVSPKVVESETRRAMCFVEARKLAPILFLDDPLVRESARGALRAGVERISFFNFHEGAEKALCSVSSIARKGR